MEVLRITLLLFVIIAPSASCTPDHISKKIFPSRSQTREIIIEMGANNPTNSRQLVSRCQQNHTFTATGQYARVQSPNFPNTYPNNVNTSICFTSPTGTRMTLLCWEFNVENESRCGYDYLGVSLGGAVTSFQIFCGTGTFRTFPSTLNSFDVVFKSDEVNRVISSDNYRFSCSVRVIQ